MKELKDEPDLFTAQPGEPSSDNVVMSTLSIRMVPVVGLSRPARSPSNVDLPLPDGPTTATNWPDGIV
jgi:hypothetical protein